jgi:aspartate/methionine/tyrosine aminotransferase
VFSHRTPADLAPNELTHALAAARAEHRSLIDLTLSNPTHAGFSYPADLLGPLADPRGLTYTPLPFGLMNARRAVAAEYERRGLLVPPEYIVLTSSTSEAYALLFKLLADAGDEVLVPRPSYPLFEHLTGLELVVARPYDLEVDARWRIDFTSIERSVTPRTRAVLVVSPNNPTGSYVTAGDYARLGDFCAPRDVAIIADEVFVDYELTPGASREAGALARQPGVLGFSLGGLSKSIGLPQVKLAWIAVSGNEGVVRRALDRLELICDTYLSVSTPVQAAAAELLARGLRVREEIRCRIANNYRELQTRVGGAPSCRVLPSDGGWYGVLQVPSLEPEESLVLSLLRDDGVLAHPGYFFDFPRESFLIVSLLTPEDPFANGIDRLLRRFRNAAAHV